jgi:hypothetical protein
VDEVLKDLVGDEGHALEISLRAADEAKSQVRRDLRYIFVSLFYQSVKLKRNLHTADTLLRSLSSFAPRFLAAMEVAAAAAAPAVANPLVRFLLSYPSFSPQSRPSHPASLSGVGISFVRRTDAAVGVDSKFVVKRLVQGSDTALQGDVEVNDVVVKVRQHARFCCVEHKPVRFRLMGILSRVGTRRLFLPMLWEKKVSEIVLIVQCISLSDAVSIQARIAA